MFVGVHPLAGFDKLLHYRVPEELAPQVAVGSLVRVPMNRTFCLGLVGEVGAPQGFPVEKLKPVAEAVYPFPALGPDLLELARWMASYYAAPLDAVIEGMIPVAARRGVRLKEEKLLAVARKAEPEERAQLARRAPQQEKLYAFLEQQFKPQAKGLVLDRLQIGPAAAAALLKRGLLREETRRIVREAYADQWADAELVESRPAKLTAEQAAASAELNAALETRRFGVSLLHGVTGSGKTEVYLQAVETALRSGGGVIYLVPEVALTPQTVSRLRSRLAAIAPGHRCVVWHSHLSEGERLDGWLALASG